MSNRNICDGPFCRRNSKWEVFNHSRPLLCVACMPYIPKISSALKKVPDPGFWIGEVIVMGLALNLTLDIAVSAGTHKLSLRIWEDVRLKQTIYRLQLKNIHYFRFVRWIKSQGLPKNLEGYCKNVLRLVLIVFAQAFRLHLIIH